jgi:hypothetical protein
LKTLAAALAGALGATSAGAVSLNPDGQGQALIFPYYTVRSSEGGNAFNTYISIVSASTIGKAVRVRFREGRAAQPVLDFNLYLSPNDAWTAALVPVENGPGAGGTRLLTRDRSCTDPPFSTTDGVASIELNAASSSDGFGPGLDRTREGFVEVIEMAALSGVTAASITHNSAGVPVNCAAVRSPLVPIPAAHLLPPRGLLSGTGTLINVNNGRDFAVAATALAELASRPLHRRYSDPYPDFFAAEIDPVSIVAANGRVYRSNWQHPVDAVSAVLMRNEWIAEYILDEGTRSLTDLVATLPTRHFYADATRFTPPFSAAATWSASCGTGGAQPLGESLVFSLYNRAELAQIADGAAFSDNRHCAAAGVGSIRGGAAHMPADTTRTAVLGSTTGGFLTGANGNVPAGFRNGWVRMGLRSPTPPPLVSLPTSMRVDLANGSVTTGSHHFTGLPVVGFAVRTFTNGTLSCTGAPACQGNYGGAFEFKYRRSISPP